MEKWIEKFFNLKEFPSKIILVLWFTSGLLLFIPSSLIIKLNLNEFIVDYGKFIGITFIISTSFLFIMIFTSIQRLIRNRKYSIKMDGIVTDSVKNLGYHEKALLREFYLQGKDTLQLPIDDEIVISLNNKGIIYQASHYGFTYVHGAYFSYTISKKAEKLLNYEILEIPTEVNPSQGKINWIQNNRPQWAKDKSRFDF